MNLNKQRKFKVLIAEDDLDDQYLMTSALLASGFKLDILTVENGLSMINLLESIKNNNGEYPDLILIDLNMPVMDGHKVISMIKSNSDFKQIPLIVFTTSNSPGDIKDAMQGGCNSYVVKPMTFDEVKLTLKDICYYWLNVSQHYIKLNEFNNLPINSQANN